MDAKTVVIPLDVYGAVLLLMDYKHKARRGEIIIKFDGKQITSVNDTMVRRPDELIKQYTAA